MAPKTKKAKAKVKKVKVKVPKIHITSSGRKYINIGNKRVYLAKDVTANQLLKFVLSRVLKKPKQRKTAGEKRTVTTHIARPTSIVSSGDDRVARILEEQKRDLERKEYEKKLKQKIDDEIVAKFEAPKHKMLMSGDDDAIEIPVSKRKSLYKNLPPLEQPVRKRALSDSEIRVPKSKARIANEIINARKEDLFQKRLEKLSWDDARKLAKDGGLPTTRINKKGAKTAQISKKKLLENLIEADVINRDEWLKEIENEMWLHAKPSAADIHDHGLDFEELETPMPELEPVSPVANVKRKIAFSPEQKDELLKDGVSDELREILQQEGEGQKDSGGLYTSQIDAMMAPYRPNYLGCFARDQLGLAARQLDKQRQFCFIQNTDTSKQKGTHWVAWFFDRDAKTIEYYNSLADPITKPMMDSIKPITNKLKKLDGDMKYQFRYNLVRDQHLKSSTCGWFSIVFLRDRLNGIPFKIASKYTSEKRIKSVIKNMKHEFPQIGLEGQGWKEMLSKAWDAAKYVGKKALNVAQTITNTKPREGWSPSIRKLLEKYGANKITQIKVYREPINSMINKVMNWVTLGKFQESLKSMDYSDAFHLFMFTTLDNGVTIRFDKNQIIEAKIQKVPSHPKAEVRAISVPNIGLNDFFNKGINAVGAKHFFTYDSRDKNCQDWLRLNLRANGLLTSELDKFIYQDAEQIYKNMGILGDVVGGVNKVVTDVAAGFDTFQNGKGRGRKGVVLPI
jgi:hypothetical protein